jgi:hypothetical protein
VKKIGNDWVISKKEYSRAILAIEQTFAKALADDPQKYSKLNKNEAGDGHFRSTEEGKKRSYKAHTSGSDTEDDPDYIPSSISSESGYDSDEEEEVQQPLKKVKVDPLEKVREQVANARMLVQIDNLCDVFSRNFDTK